MDIDGDKFFSLKVELNSAIISPYYSD